MVNDLEGGNGKEAWIDKTRAELLEWKIIKWTEKVDRLNNGNNTAGYDLHVT